MPLSKETLKRHIFGTIFIETGTYHGDGIQRALDSGFDTVHSVELDDTLYRNAVKRFLGDTRVHVWKGDSVDTLPRILEMVGDQRCTIWLDAHASGPLPGGRTGGTPVLDEIRAIGKSNVECTILIDDRRLFGTVEWSGVTQDQVMKEIELLQGDYTISYEDGYIEHDIIVCTPKSSE